MTHYIYARLFKNPVAEKHFVTKNSAYYPSIYFPLPMRSALNYAISNHGSIQKTDYIIGPIYESGDFQIGVTGTVEINETNNTAVSRELGEEIGLIPKATAGSVANIIKTYSTHKRTFVIYNIFLKKCIPVLEHQHDAIISKNVDNKSQKIGCYVYGDKKDVLKYLNSEHIYRYKSEDKIIGIVAVQAGKIFDML